MEGHNIESWPSPLIPSPLVSGQSAIHNVSAWTFTSKQSPISDFTKAVDLSAEFPTGAFEDVGEEVSSKATSEANKVRGQRDVAYAAPDQGRSPHKQLRRHWENAASQCTPSQAATFGIPVGGVTPASPADIQQQLREESEAILTSFRHTLSQSMTLRDDFPRLSLDGDSVGNFIGNPLFDTPPSPQEGTEAPSMVNGHGLFTPPPVPGAAYDATATATSSPLLGEGTQEPTAAAAATAVLGRETWMCTESHPFHQGVQQQSSWDEEADNGQMQGEQQGAEQQLGDPQQQGWLQSTPGLVLPGANQHLGQRDQLQRQQHMTSNGAYGSSSTRSSRSTSRASLAAPKQLRLKLPTVAAPNTAESGSGRARSQRRGAARRHTGLRLSPRTASDPPSPSSSPSFAQQQQQGLQQAVGAAPATRLVDYSPSLVSPPQASEWAESNASVSRHHGNSRHESAMARGSQSRYQGTAHLTTPPSRFGQQQPSRVHDNAPAAELLSPPPPAASATPEVVVAGGRRQGHALRRPLATQQGADDHIDGSQVRRGVDGRWWARAAAATGAARVQQDLDQGAALSDDLSVEGSSAGSNGEDEGAANMPPHSPLNQNPLVDGAAAVPLTNGVAQQHPDFSSLLDSPASVLTPGYYSPAWDPHGSLPGEGSETGFGRTPAPAMDKDLGGFSDILAAAGEEEDGADEEQRAAAAAADLVPPQEPWTGEWVSQGHANTLAAEAGRAAAQSLTPNVQQPPGGALLSDALRALCLEYSSPPVLDDDVSPGLGTGTASGSRSKEACWDGCVPTFSQHPPLRSQSRMQARLQSADDGDGFGGPVRLFDLASHGTEGLTDVPPVTPSTQQGHQEPNTSGTGSNAGPAEVAPVGGSGTEQPHMGLGSSGGGVRDLQDETSWASETDRELASQISRQRDCPSFRRRTWDAGASVLPGSTRAAFSEPSSAGRPADAPLSPSSESSRLQQEQEQYTGQMHNYHQQQPANSALSSVPSSAFSFARQPPTEQPSSGEGEGARFHSELRPSRRSTLETPSSGLSDFDGTGFYQQISTGRFRADSTGGRAPGSLGSARRQLYGALPVATGVPAQGAEGMGGIWRDNPAFEDQDEEANSASTTPLPGANIAAHPSFDANNLGLVPKSIAFEAIDDLVHAQQQDLSSPPSKRPAALTANGALQQHEHADLADELVTGSMAAPNAALHDGVAGSEQHSEGSQYGGRTGNRMSVRALLDRLGMRSSSRDDSPSNDEADEDMRSIGVDDANVDRSRSIAGAAAQLRVAAGPGTVLPSGTVSTSSIVDPEVRSFVRELENVQVLLWQSLAAAGETALSPPGSLLTPSPPNTSAAAARAPAAATIATPLGLGSALYVASTPDHSASQVLARRFASSGGAGAAGAVGGPQATRMAAAAIGKALGRTVKWYRENQGLQRVNEQLRGELSRYRESHQDLESRSRVLSMVLEESERNAARQITGQKRQLLQQETQLDAAQQRINQLEHLHTQLSLERQQAQQQAAEAVAQAEALAIQVAQLDERFRATQRAKEEQQRAAEVAEEEARQERLQVEQLLAACAEAEARTQQLLAELRTAQEDGSKRIEEAESARQAAEVEVARSRGLEEELWAARQEADRLQERLDAADMAAAAQAEQQEAELEAARMAMEQLMAERTAARAEVARKEEEAQRAAASVAEELRQVQQRHEVAIAEAEVEVEELRRQLEAAAWEAGRREAEVAGALARERSAQEGAERMRSELEGLRRRYAELQEEFASNDRIAMEMLQQTEASRQEAAEHASRNQQLRRNLDAMAASASAAAATHAAAVARLEAALASETSRANEAGLRYSQLEEAHASELLQLQLQLQAAQHDLKQAEADAAQLQATHGSLQQQLQQLGAELAAAHQELDVSRQQQAQLSAAHAAQVEQAGKEAAEAASAREEVARLRQEAAEVQSQVKEHLIQERRLQEELQAVQQEVRELEGKLADSQARIGTLAEELQGAQAELAEAQGTVSSVQGRLEGAEQDKAALAERVRQLQEEMEEGRERLEDAEQDKAALAERVRQLREELEESRQLAETRMEEVGRLQDQLLDIRESRCRLQDDLDATTAELTITQASLSEHQAQLADLRFELQSLEEAGQQLTAQAEAAEARAREEAGARGAAEAEVSRLQGVVEAEQGKAETLEQEVSAAIRRNVELQRQLEAAQAQQLAAAAAAAEAVRVQAEAACASASTSGGMGTEEQGGVAARPPQLQALAIDEEEQRRKVLLLNAAEVVACTPDASPTAASAAAQQGSGFRGSGARFLASSEGGAPSGQQRQHSVGRRTWGPEGGEPFAASPRRTTEPNSLKLANQVVALMSQLHDLSQRHKDAEELVGCLNQQLATECRRRTAVEEELAVALQSEEEALQKLQDLQREREVAAAVAAVEARAGILDGGLSPVAAGQRGCNGSTAEPWTPSSLMVEAGRASMDLTGFNLSTFGSSMLEGGVAATPPPTAPHAAALPYTGGNTSAGSGASLTSRGAEATPGTPSSVRAEPGSVLGPLAGVFRSPLDGADPPTPLGTATANDLGCSSSMFGYHVADGPSSRVGDYAGGGPGPLGLAVASALVPFRRATLSPVPEEGEGAPTPGSGRACGAQLIGHLLELRYVMYQLERKAENLGAVLGRPEAAPDGAGSLATPVRPSRPSAGSCSESTLRNGGGGSAAGAGAGFGDGYPLSGNPCSEAAAQQLTWMADNLAGLMERAGTVSAQLGECLDAAVALQERASAAASPSSVAASAGVLTPLVVRSMGVELEGILRQSEEAKQEAERVLRQQQAQYCAELARLRAEADSHVALAAQWRERWEAAEQELQAERLHRQQQQVHLESQCAAHEVTITQLTGQLHRLQQQQQQLVAQLQRQEQEAARQHAEQQRGGGSERTQRGSNSSVGVTLATSDGGRSGGGGASANGGAGGAGNVRRRSDSEGSCASCSGGTPAPIAVTRAAASGAATQAEGPGEPERGASTPTSAATGTRRRGRSGDPGASDPSALEQQQQQRESVAGDRNCAGDGSCGEAPSEDEMRLWVGLLQLIQAYHAGADRSGSRGDGGSNRGNNNSSGPALTDPSASAAAPLAMLLATTSGDASSALQSLHPHPEHSLSQRGDAPPPGHSSGSARGGFLPAATVAALATSSGRAEVLARVLEHAELLRKEKHHLARMLRRVRDGDAQLAEKLRREHQTLLAKYTELKLASRLTLKRLGRENSELHAQVMQQIQARNDLIAARLGGGGMEGADGGGEGERRLLLTEASNDAAAPSSM
ncbi:hypothetical protein Agub_g7444 [Astrephomene gubernaculifera]|uniref:Uncharacterized protein n=1 Tax=Astrephomene gubernaculifera TaxID=47775 RepID=A0AAD3DST6_9CHLO|nr:hypothetical protein Agub_g7444 [Astrephomene gubernaculifera]